MTRNNCRELHSSRPRAQKKIAEYFSLTMSFSAASAPILVLVAMAPPAPSVLGVSRRLLTSLRNPLDALQVEQGGRARPRRAIRQIYQAGPILEYPIRRRILRISAG